ncbi:MAG TPA: TIGR03086 family metal-binding protein [Nocardioidaceae bacterium]|nr:TIGR03086 family metal-binding protein [Nocardioidaceae bacterium]
MMDLQPAARQLAELVNEVPDNHLTAPTPCEQMTMGDLVHHIDGLARAFTAAATKDLGPETSRAPLSDGSQLGGDWRSRIPDQLEALAEAWRNPAAWDGMTQAGGADLPGEMAGKVALDELVVHGWDLALASGRAYDIDRQTIEACLELVAVLSPPEQRTGGDGLFERAVGMPADAPLLDRLIALTGRDPTWTPPTGS